MVSEALTNVAKYAQATQATVAVRRLNGSVTVEVTDDGVGGADAAGGSGLRGLADRLAALDGTLRSTARPDTARGCMLRSRGMKERIDELAARLTELRDAYYRGEPKVADADYDALEDELRALLAEHPDLTPDPNPLEQVGAPSVLHAPVRHSRPMLSLEKATKPEQVEAFFARFPGQPVIVMPKLDGLSLAVVYEGGRLARAVTRGDGTTGDDVTVLVRALADGVPDRIDAAGRVEVRGEAVMLRSTFAAYNEAHPDKPLINPRNAAAGTVRAKDPATVAGRGCASSPSTSTPRTARPPTSRRRCRRSASTPPTCATPRTRPRRRR